MKKTASAQLLEGQQGIAFSCHCWLRWEKEEVSWDASFSHTQVKKGWGCLLKCSILYKHMIYRENGYHNKAETKSNFSNFHVVFTLPIIAKIMLSISKKEKPIVYQPARQDWLVLVMFRFLLIKPSQQIWHLRIPAAF